MPSDVSLSLLRHGYRFEPLLADRPGASAPVRVLGRPALMVAGEDAMKLFYDQGLMVREGARPCTAVR